MTKTFAERCHIAQKFLPDAQYKAMLTALHEEMLAKLAEQPAPVVPVQHKPTTYTERFTHAVAVLCGAQPPAEMVAEWLEDVTVNGGHRLQSWVGVQHATPSWAQCIVVLDAAHVLANEPEEGEGHEDAPQAQRKPLTDEQMAKAWSVADGEHNSSASVKRRITRAIEAAHKIFKDEK